MQPLSWVAQWRSCSCRTMPVSTGKVLEWRVMCKSNRMPMLCGIYFIFGGNIVRLTRLQWVYLQDWRHWKLQGENMSSMWSGMSKFVNLEVCYKFSMTCVWDLSIIMNSFSFISDLRKTTSGLSCWYLRARLNPFIAHNCSTAFQKEHNLKILLWVLHYCVYINKIHKNYQLMNHIFSSIFVKLSLQSYNCLKLRNIHTYKCQNPTPIQNFQKLSSHVALHTT